VTDAATLLGDQRLVVNGAIHLVEHFRSLVPPPPHPTDWSGPASKEYLDLLATLVDGLDNAAAVLRGARADLDSAISTAGLCARE
jgi:hypothetical protein